MGNSVASCVKDIINKSPFTSEMLIQEIISFANLAKFIKPKVEAMYGDSVNTSTIVMAIRRYASELKKKEELKVHGTIGYDISMKTNIYDINFTRNESFMSKLSTLYQKIHVDSGDFINVSIGSHEISLMVSQKYKDVVDKLLEGENIVARMQDLVALTIVFNDGDFLKTPGIMYLALRKLAWENINVFEIVSTTNILTFAIEKKDSLRAYATLQEFLNEEL
mgnify:FL=1